MCASISRVDSPRLVEREDLVVKALKTPLALAHDLRLKRPIAIPRRVDPDLAVLGDQPSSVSSRCACSPPRPAAPGGAHSRRDRSARPPSPAPPAAWSTATSRPPGPTISSSVRAPASSSSTTSSGSFRRISSGIRSRIPDGVAGVSPNGSPPAPSRLETLARSILLLVVEGMTLPFDHAYTDPRTLPRGGAENPVVAGAGPAVATSTLDVAVDVALDVATHRSRTC